jgi:hypothetical protein
MVVVLELLTPLFGQPPLDVPQSDIGQTNFTAWSHFLKFVSDPNLHIDIVLKWSGEPLWLSSKVVKMKK